MTQSVIQTRIDKSVKVRAERIFSRLGLTLNDGIRMFVNQVTIDRGMPFRPLIGDEPNEKTCRIIEETNAGRGVKTLKTKEELFKDLEI